jgi:hypothetical protein
MTERRPCPPAPGPLEEYAARFDDLLVSLAQRRGFREYPAGLLAPRDRNKTLTLPLPNTSSMQVGWPIDVECGCSSRRRRAVAASAA